MEQTDVKQRRLSPWKVGVAFAFLAAIICLAFFFFYILFFIFFK